MKNNKWQCLAIQWIPFCVCCFHILSEVKANHSACLTGHCEKLTLVLIGWSTKQTQPNFRALLTKTGFWLMFKQITLTSTSEWKCPFEKTLSCMALRFFAAFDLGRDFTLLAASLLLTLKADGKDFSEESLLFVWCSSWLSFFLWSYHLQEGSAPDCQTC